MSHPLVRNIRRDETYDVYVGRGSKWGNPFVAHEVGGREKAIEMYINWMLAPAQRHLIDDLHELRGKTLGCFCSPMPCHAGVLAEWANHE